MVERGSKVDKLHGRNNVIVPNAERLLEESDTSVDALFFWIRALVRENLGEETNATREPGLILLPGNAKKHHVLVQRTFEPGQETKDDQYGRGRARIGLRETYTVMMLEEGTGGAPQRVLEIGRSKVTQSGSILLSPLADPGTKVDILTPDAWVDIAATPLRTLSDQPSSDEQHALAAQDALVRATLIDFKNYLQ